MSLRETNQLSSERNFAGSGAANRMRANILTGMAGRAGLLFKPASGEGEARRNAVIVFSIRLLSAALAYLSQIVLARAIGVFDYGVYVAAWSAVLVLGHVSGLGFSLSVTRLVPELRQAGDDAGLHGLLRASRAIGFIAAAAVAIAGVFVLQAFGGIIGPERLWPSLILLFCLPFFTLTEIQDGFARCFGAPMLALGPPYLLRPVLILVLLGLFIAMGWRAEAIVAAQAAVLATVLTAVLQSWLLRRRVGQHVRSARPRHALASWLTASLPLLFAEGSRIILQNSDVLVLSAFAGPVEVATYFAVTKTMVLGAFVAFAVNAAVSHRYAEYHVAGERERLIAFMQQSTHWVFWPTLGATLLMLALGKPFLSLFGPDFLSAYPLMFIFSAGLVLRASIGPAERLLAALGGQRTCARVYLATLGIGLMLQILLTALYGGSGLAWAVTLTAVVETVLLTAVLQKHHRIKVGLWRAWTDHA